MYSNLHLLLSELDGILAKEVSQGPLDSGAYRACKLAEGVGNSLYNWLAGITVFCATNGANSLWNHLQAAQLDFY